MKNLFLVIFLGFVIVSLTIVLNSIIYFIAVEHTSFSENITISISGFSEEFFRGLIGALFIFLSKYRVDNFFSIFKVASVVSMVFLYLEKIMPLLAVRWSTLTTEAEIQINLFYLFFNIIMHFAIHFGLFSLSLYSAVSRLWGWFILSCFIHAILNFCMAAYPISIFNAESLGSNNLVKLFFLILLFLLNCVFLKMLTKKTSGATSKISND